MTAQTEATTATVGPGLTATGAGLFGYAADAAGAGGGAQSAIGSVGIWMALIGFATTAIPFLTRMVESRALSLYRENRDLKKRLRLKRAWIIAACKSCDELELPAWFDNPIGDDGAEPKSTDSTPPVVAKRDEDTVDLPRAD